MPQENVEAPLTGKILSVNVKPGDEVNEDDILCVLESMKMENPILAPVSGKIAKIEVAAEQLVSPGKTLIIIEY